jgi:glycosyltransferase involved in cell wall biosynthesis
MVENFRTKDGFLTCPNGAYALNSKLNLLWLNWRDIKNPDAGGAELFTYEVARRFVRRGWNVTLFTSAFGSAPPEEVFEGIEIIRKGGSLQVYGRAKDYCKSHAYDFDLVIDEINTRPFMTPRFLKTRPILALVHQLAREYWFYETSWPISWLGYYYLENAWLKPYRNVMTLTVSESTRRDLLMLGFTNVHIVPEAISVETCHSIPPKEINPTLVFVGRLKRVKKPEHAIWAFERLRQDMKNAKLWIVGDGYMKPRLEAMAGEGVVLMGRVSEQTKVDLMSHAHVLLFPAVREGWGLSITEAGARGTPVVAYDVPGVRDSVVDGKTGLLVRPDDWASMATQASMLLKDKGLRETMALNSIEFSRGLSWERTETLFSQKCLQALNARDYKR